MSLDIVLRSDQPIPVDPTPQIVIRASGQLTTISRAEWDARYPDREPMTVTPAGQETHTVWRGNITHNLSRMAEAAGLYRCLWRPDEYGITTARDLLQPLREGLAVLRATPARFEALNPANGWGSYPILVLFVADYLAACERWPEATVEVWR